jgi:hypothetical protein
MSLIWCCLQQVIIIAAIGCGLGARPLPTQLSEPRPPAMATVVIAERISWHGFVRYWRNFASRTDRIVLIVGLVAATALFIITRGKWIK